MRVLSQSEQTYLPSGRDSDERYPMVCLTHSETTENDIGSAFGILYRSYVTKLS